MINTDRLKKVLAQYKIDFTTGHWEDEKYKWEAVKWFQDHWDIKTDDFATMLKISLDKTANLLASANRFPREMIVQFAKSAPEEVRAMFMDLYDESEDVYERISTFKSASSSLLNKYGGKAAQHFQDENSISVYLWLRYPDKYYIYKYSEIKDVAHELQCNYSFKKGAYSENIHNCIKLYDEICEGLKKDEALVELLKSHITDDCWPDTNLKTLTIDVGFYISRSYIVRAGEDGWWPSLKEYQSGITTEQWVSLLNDKEIFDKEGLEILKRLKDMGGTASCGQLAKKYGESYNFYSNKSSNLARRVAEKTGCPVLDHSNAGSQWWHIMFQGKNTREGYSWRLRDELSKALDQVDLSGIPLYASKKNTDNKDNGERQYWWLNANPRIWSFSSCLVGQIQSYTLFNENGNKRRVFQNFLDAKEGDYVIGYESNPVKQVVALARVSTANDGEKIYFEKTEGLEAPIDYQTLKAVPELAHMEFFQNPNGTLFKLTKEEYETILDMIREDNPALQPVQFEPYSKDKFLSEVYMDPDMYERLRGVLLNNMNVILQGAPGVGKTFAAKRLAYSIMGRKDDSHIEVVQFHQNYSYEDFMMGYKPDGTGFKLKYGVFYRFCQKAANHPNDKFFFIIDEINRGNLSKIFGCDTAE